MPVPSKLVMATGLVLTAGGCTAFTPSISTQKQVTSKNLRAHAFQQSAPTEASSTWGFSTTAAAAMTATAAIAAGAVQGKSRSQVTARRVAGVCLPLEDKFDPLDLGNTDAKMDRYTAVEIKHGRIAMIATLGYIFPTLFRFPGCEDFKNGFGAFQSIPLEGWIQLVALIGAHEVLVKPREGGMGMYDFGFGTEMLDGVDDEELERRQTVERNNGRLAMVAILGMMWQDGQFGIPPIEFISKYGWWGGPQHMYVKGISNILIGGQNGVVSPFAALPKERRRTSLCATGVLPDVEDGSMFLETMPYEEAPEMSVACPYLRFPKQLKGYVGGEKGFDPIGISDIIPVYWCREAELKHGRVAMLATIGWMAVDSGARFPGPKFQAVGSALEAHDIMVDAGYMGIFLGMVGTLELYGLKLACDGVMGYNPREAGDFFVGKAFLPKEKAAADEMRLKELENGRLAMMAIGGIATVAAGTGKPWPFFD